jgi:hypothetical protein
LRLSRKPKTQQSDEKTLRVAARLEDIPEIERTAKGIIEVLKKFGGYEPEVDNIYVYRIANCTFYLKRTEEMFLDAPTATESTYSRVIDMQTKQQAMIDHAMEKLALNRKNRIERQGEADFVKKLREEIEKAKKA